MSGFGRIIRQAMEAQEEIRRRKTGVYRWETEKLEETKEKPLGVVLIGAYLLFIAFTSLFFAFRIAIEIPGIGAVPCGTSEFDFYLFATIAHILDQQSDAGLQLWALFFLAIGALYSASAYGLFEMKKLGRVMTIICALLQIATALYILPLALPHLYTPTILLILYMPASYPSLGVFGGIVALIIGLTILVYLFGDIKHVSMME